jgi:hypothetical protein
MRTALWAVPVVVAAAVVAVVGLSRLPLERIAGPPPKPEPQPEKSSPPNPPFTPGVPGRSPAEVCQSTSPACQAWTELARKCEDNMRQREAGFMGQQPPHCSEMEALRERVTGVPDSSSPGAYQF